MTTTAKKEAARRSAVVRRLAVAVGDSQAVASRALGVSPAAVSLWIREKRTPPLCVVLLAERILADLARRPS